MAGTPAWNGEEEQGNHSWVEVFDPNGDTTTNANGNRGGQWIFLKPSPGITKGVKVDKANADDLEREPCKRWFCGAGRFDVSTKVFATRFTKADVITNYPMAWDVGDEGVPGEDRSK